MSADVTPEDVLAYWIGAAGEGGKKAKDKFKLWFEKSDETDAEIAARFGHLLEPDAADWVKDWSDRGAQGRLAAIIVLDQFPRNIFRGEARAFAFDAQARELASEALAAGDDKPASEVECLFLYLPFEHSEQGADQVRSVELFAALKERGRAEFDDFLATTLDYAKAHKEVIDRFGRFPHRNEALGRPSTPEEQAYLSRPGAGF